MSVTGIIRRSLPPAPIAHGHDPHARPGRLELPASARSEWTRPIVVPRDTIAMSGGPATGANV